MADEKTQIIDYANPQHLKRDAPKLHIPPLLWVLGALFLFAFMYQLFFPPLGRSRETANRVKCATNLRQITQACLLYANEYTGQYPPDLAVLLTSQDLGASCLVCPSDVLERARGTSDEAAALIRARPDLYLSYIYLGAGMTTASITPETILAYEPLTNHDADGMNVLFGDGHAEFIAKPAAQKLLAALQAGQNPPPTP